MVWMQLLLSIKGRHPDLQYSIGLYCNKMNTLLTIFDSTATCRIKSWQDVNYNIQVDTVFTLNPQEPGQKFTILTTPHETRDIPTQPIVHCVSTVSDWCLQIVQLLKLKLLTCLLKTLVAIFQIIGMRGGGGWRKQTVKFRKCTAGRGENWERGENFQKPGQTVIPHDDKAQECWNCEQCPKKFVSKTGLRWHTKMKHDNSLVVNADGATTDEEEVSKEVEEEKKSHPCLNCPKGYMSIQALVWHTKDSDCAQQIWMLNQPSQPTKINPTKPN